MGIVVNTYSAATPNGVVPRMRRITLGSPPRRKMPRIPAVASENAMGTPSSRATTIARNGR